MKPEMYKYQLRIFGDLYTLVSDADKTFMGHVATKVDTLMRDIAAQHQALDTKKIAVLATLQMCEELLQLQNVMQQEQLISSQIATLLAEAQI